MNEETKIRIAFVCTIFLISLLIAFGIYGAVRQLRFWDVMEKTAMLEQQVYKMCIEDQDYLRKLKE